MSAGESTVRSAGAIRKGCANVGRSDGVGTSSKASAGGGGGRLGGAIPRAGVGRKALIGSLGVRKPGCGVGGVCAIIPAETPSAPGGAEPDADTPVRRGRPPLRRAGKGALPLKPPAPAFSPQPRPHNFKPRGALQTPPN